MKYLDRSFFSNEFEKCIRAMVRQELRNANIKLLLEIRKMLKEGAANYNKSHKLQEISKEQIFEKTKIRILTHEGHKPMNELSYLEQNKDKFFIWIDERRPEVRINNKVQQKMGNAIQLINLLVILLEKHRNLLSHEVIFDTLDSKGRKGNSGNLRLPRKKFRPNVVKMIFNLHKRTDYQLKNQIVSIRGCGYRFDLNNIKFCIIYKGSNKLNTGHV